MPSTQFRLLPSDSGIFDYDDPPFCPGSEFLLSPTHEFSRHRNTQRSTYLTLATEVVGCVYLSRDGIVGLASVIPALFSESGVRGEWVWSARLGLVAWSALRPPCLCCLPLAAQLDCALASRIVL